jgi:hypothetical protein
MTLKRTLKYAHDFADQKALRSAIEEVDELLRAELPTPSDRTTSVGTDEDIAEGEYIRDAWLELDGADLEAERGEITVAGKFSAHAWDVRATLIFRGLHVFGEVQGLDREKVTAVVTEIQQILARHTS